MEELRSELQAWAEGRFVTKDDLEKQMSAMRQSMSDSFLDVMRKEFKTIAEEIQRQERAENIATMKATFHRLEIVAKYILPFLTIVSIIVSFMR